MLNYREQGKGPVVVLLHGFPLSGEIWERQLDFLSSQYRVIVPDLPGHGKSAPLPAGQEPTMELMAKAVLALMDHLKVERFAVAGHSMGGYVTLALRKLAPQRVVGLAMVASQARDDTPEAREGRIATAAKVMEQGAGVVADAMAPKLFGPGMQPGSEEYQQVLSIMRQSPAEGVVAVLKAMASREDMRPHLPEIGVPTLVIAGEQDAIIPLERAEYTAITIPHAVLAKVESGHMPMMERPYEVNQALIRWLELVY